LQDNPWNPALRWHRLRGAHQHLDAVSITLSYRITLEMKIVDHEIILIAVGTHDQVY
jgi:mRNA-degrading endonuclease YafQ of YafQ-DinJ toxin-antitoxin module